VTSAAEGNRYGAGGASPLEGAIAALVHQVVLQLAAEEVRRLVREELAAGAGAETEWLTQPAAGRVAGVSPQTIRGWQAARLARSWRSSGTAQDILGKVRGRVPGRGG
jgi:hypothetical protein